MMKKILLVTPLYPLPTKENNCTYVCHFFACEWVKMGYEVVVIHVQPVHCWLWHLLVKYFGKKLKNYAGGGNYYARKIKETEHYTMDNVPIYRIPIYNILPRGRFPQKSINSLLNEIHGILKIKKFVPDVIVGQMLPIEIIPQLNLRYHAKTCMVAHGASGKLKEMYNNWEEMIDSYDGWGFRSKPIKNNFEIYLKPVKKSFYCFSGIPENYLAPHNPHKYDKAISKFLFIGELIERKHPVTLLEAIPAAITDDYQISFVGDGPERKRLEGFIKDNALSEHATLIGRVPRDKVTDFLDEVDCFIMVSCKETYGLVYLEAMARGCITIASRNEGFDGVIEDGINGFLCNSGDSAELTRIIQRINNMSYKERQEVSDRALETARKMTDYLMAKEYVNNLEKL